MSQFSPLSNFTCCFSKIRFHILTSMPRSSHAAFSHVNRQVIGYSTTKDQGRISISVARCARAIMDGDLETIWAEANVAHLEA